MGNVIEFLREVIEGENTIKVKFNPGGEDTATADHFDSAGVDAPPLPDDYMGLVKGAGTGRWIVLGYLDPANKGTAAPGELRLYSRDANGTVMCSVYLNADGEVHLGDDVAAALMARADRVEAELEKIKTAHNTHIHVTTATVGGGSTAGVIDVPAIQYTPGDVGADKVYGT